MASIAETPIVADPVPTKRARSKKALKPKNLTTNEANIMAGTVSEPSPIAVPPEDSIAKENHESLKKTKTKKGGSKGKKDQDLSLENALQEMQEKLEKLSLEKQQTEEMLKAKDEVLKQKEEELEMKGKEQEKLQGELKKLQKMKEFKPTMSFPIMQIAKENENDEKDKKKKKGDAIRKKPCPPYALWLKDQWIEVKKATPDADFKEVSNLLGVKWKTVTAEEKKPYEERYQAEKEAYLKIVGNEKREIEAMKLLEEDQKQKTAMELLEQYMQFVQETEKEPKKSKKEKDPLKPKHPMSAFFLFSKERRAALSENNKAVEVAKIAGEEWRSMTEAQKAPYEEMAMKNKEEYAEEMKLYKQKKEEEAANLKKDEDEMTKLQKQEALQLLKKKEKTENLIKQTKQKNKNQKEEKKNVDPNKPKKPASSYILFSKEERKKLSEERPGINNSTLVALISLKWKELSEEAKQMWNDKAAVAMEAYKKELEEYNKSAAESCSSN